MKKRILAMFLACMMILSVIAVPAFAAEEAPCTHPENKRTYGTILKGEKFPETCADESIVVEWTCECGHTDVSLVVGEHTTTTSFTDQTCEEPAKITKVCACGEVSDTQEVGEALGHDYVVDHDNEATVDPSCGVSGSFVYKCTRCGDTYEEAAEGLEHDYVAVENGYVPPTCSKTSGFKYVCSHCDDEKIIYTEEDDVGYEAKLPHTERVNPKKDATCNEAGWEEWKDCSVCGEVILEKVAIPVDEDAHNKELKVLLKEATCTTNGVGQYQCSICKKDLGYEVIEGGHDWVLDESKSVAPKCGVDGKNVYKCSKGCTGEDATKEEIVEATNDSHTWVAYDNETKFIEATCTEPAKIKTGKYCSACKTDAEDVVVTTLENMPALNHDLEMITDFEGGKAPGCGEAGTYYWACTRCNYTEGSEEEPLHDAEVTEHNYEPIANGYVAPTCTTTAGYKHKCSLCDDETIIYPEEGDLLFEDKLPHTERVNPKKDATCNEAGWEEWKDCSVCGEVILEKVAIPVDEDAHVWEIKTTLKAATCTTDGVAEYACANNCGVETKFDTIPADHTWDVDTKLISENSHAIYNPCTKCDAVVVYKYLGDLAEGETEADYNGKIVDSLDLDVTVVITGTVDNSISLTVNVVGLAEGAKAWVEVNGNVVEMNGTHATYVTGVNKIASTFNVVVKVEEYGVVRTSEAYTYKFAQAASVPTVEVKQTTKLENATAKFLNRGVLIGETVRLIYRVEAAETASVVLVNGDTTYTVDLADLTVDADGKYTVEFEIAADEWTTEFAATIVDADGKAISNTNYYSVAQYAQNNVNKVNATFKAVLLAMMKAAA